MPDEVQDHDVRVVEQGVPQEAVRPDRPGGKIDHTGGIVVDERILHLQVAESQASPGRGADQNGFPAP